MCTWKLGASISGDCEAVTPFVIGDMTLQLKYIYFAIYTA